MIDHSTGSPAPTPDLSVSIRVAERLAEAKDVEATDLPPIYEHVDLDAVESVIASAEDDLWISWMVEGHRVTVDGSGTVTVE